MSNVCIITDNTALFTQADFPGHERVHIVPLGLQNTGDQEDKLLSGGKAFPQHLISPSPQEFIRLYARLSRKYDSILVLMLCASLSPTLEHALLASNQYSNGVSVEVVDSQTTSIGLGTLVQLAAGAASDGASLKEIDVILRINIPRIFMLFCVPDLTCLARAGLMNSAQALVGEMMGMLPVFAFEEGRLVPMEKVRTPRHLLEVFQDFMGEFESPSRVALLGSMGLTSLRTGSLRQFIKETFPGTLFSQHMIPPHLAALLGPRSIGLFVIESADQRSNENRLGY